MREVVHNVNPAGTKKLAPMRSLWIAADMLERPHAAPGKRSIIMSFKKSPAKTVSV